MKKLSPLEKMGLVAAVVIACTYFYMKKVYEPQEKILKQTVAELNKIVGEINGLKTVPPMAGVKSQLKKHEDELKALKEKLTTTTIQTGSDREVSLFLGRIIDMMQFRGFAVRSITPVNASPEANTAPAGSTAPAVPQGDTATGGATEETLYEWHTYDVELSGGYNGFVALLIDLRKKPDAVKVEKIEISRKEGEDVTIKMNLKI